MNSTNRSQLLLHPDVWDKILYRISLWKISHGYIMFPLCVLGMVGNIISFFILSRKSVRSSTIAVYLRCLAVADFSVLLTAIFRYRCYKLFFDDDLERWSIYHFDPYIQVYVEPFHWIALGASSFIILVLSAERYLAVKFPITIKNGCTSSRVRAVITAVVITITLITLPNFFAYNVEPFLRNNNTYVSVAILSSMGRRTLYHCTFHNYVIPFMWYIIPWVLLAIFSAMLTKHVRKSSKIRAGITTLSSSNRNLSVLIIMIVVIYMICNFPNCIIVFYNLVHHTMENNVCTHETQGLLSKTSKVYDALEVIGEILNVLNSCINIIIYCIVGTKFRRELKKCILCHLCKCKKLNSVHPNPVNIAVVKDVAIDTASTQARN